MKHYLRLATGGVFNLFFVIIDFDMRFDSVLFTSLNWDILFMANKPGNAGNLVKISHNFLNLMGFKGRNSAPPAGEWLQYETISMWSLTTV